MAGARALLAAVAPVGAAVVLGITALTPAATPTPAAGAGAVEATAATPAVARRHLPPVTEHPIDPSALGVVAKAGGASVVQTIQLTVVGGDLSLEQSSAEVLLQRVGDLLVGVLPPVRVVDARGTHQGWEVRYRISGVDAADGRPLPGRVRVTVRPSTPVVVSGLPDGLRPGPVSDRGHRSQPLFSAAPLTGGGTYEAGATMEVSAPSASVDGAVVRLALEVG